MSRCPSLLLALGLLGLATPGPAKAPAPSLAVLRTLPVAGEGGWDYVTLDPKAGRLYLPRATRVLVLDLEGKTRGEIPATSGVHGVALAPDLDLGYTSNGKAGTMTVFRLSTLEVVREVKTTGANPDSILYDGATGQVITFNGGGRNATVFDARTLEVKGTIAIGGKPEFCAGDGRGRVFVNVEDTAELLAIDARTLGVEARWSLAPLADPTGLAMDTAHQILFSVGRNRLMAVVDATSGKLLQTLPIGAGTDAAAFDPGTGRAYASNGEGSLTVAGPDGHGRFAVLATVATAKGARTMALDPRTHLIYLPTAEFGPAPEAGPGQPSRPPLVPGSFRILVVGPAR
jgi:DNA-binding beta-propeller fold protein YncE